VLVTFEGSGFKRLCVAVGVTAIALPAQCGLRHQAAARVMPPKQYVGPPHARWRCMPVPSRKVHPR
jgi:hypothetical protein